MVHLLVQPIFLLISQQNLGSRVYDGLFDDTFSGIYRLSFFDWALLLPYFSILVILSVYGVHRYETIRRYRKHKKSLLHAAPQHFTALPRITVQLPLYNERYVVERLLEETVKLDYPKELLQIQVLDDSTDETHAFTERLCNEYRAAGFPIEYRHRTNRHGFKAGALQEGLETATGELIAIFDADFVPPKDFLRRTVDYFVDPEVGVV
ncbi:MAG: glycosyltransferase, partial [Bryobacteraceae bacterium]